MTFPAIPLPCPPANTDVEAPRKRRRRAPASGAADDCFACHKRSVKCDRRRPYCSPCLEIGSECSGYKTQLTWGVGVASRGKLRGLSLPIAKSAPVKNSPPRTFRQRSNTTNKLTMQQRKEHDIEIKIECEPPMASPYTNYDFVHMNPKSPSSPAPSDLSQPDYTAPQHHEGGHGHLLRQSLSRLQPPAMRYGEDLSSSTGSLSAYSDNDYSPIATQFDDSAYLSPTAYEYGTSPEHAFSTSADQRAPTSFPDQFYLRSPASHQSFDDQSQSSASVRHSESESDYDNDFVGSYPQSSDLAHINKWDAEEPLQQQPLQIITPPQYNFGMGPDISPRLTFYVNYYEKIICPITVAIDSPSNPYRCEILRLATSSPSLQHAICALASCNLRTRRRQSLGQLGQFPTATTVPATQLSASSIPLDDASVAEEYHHRSQAVALLNYQLSSPELAKEDSVLATLLMLCHYRMCETGIAQFKTQFAGVKKLLGIRAAAGVRNDGWMESIFTFFDAITASVNEREAQLGEYLNLGESLVSLSNSWPHAHSASPPQHQQYNGYPLENLAGCCGRLFKTVAKLGKLNMLSHIISEDVKDPALQNLSSHPQTYVHAPHSPNYHQHSAPNSWNDSNTNNYSSSPTSYSSSPPGGQDTRHDFWALWREVRHALQSWSFDSGTIQLPCTPRPEQIRDFGMVSEAFRHAALLYTERLANPTLPSSDLQIQGHVSQIFFYITSLDNSDGKGLPAGKFLLWPLFVAGSEACGELERNMVRDRCNGISRRGGYANNMAGLEALERVWRLLDNEGMSRSRAFSWERDGWMAQVEGEFIMA